MRKIFITILVVFIANSVSALEIKDRMIIVKGSSEMILSPDEIEIEITLEEQGGNYGLSKIEQILWGTLGQQEIGKEQIVLTNVNVMYYWYYWWKNREATKKTKKIVLNLDHKTDFLKLAKALNKEWIIDIKIIGVSNKNIEKHIQEVQSKAMKSAKEKASYLLENIDEELGKIVSVVELDISKNHSNTMQLESGKNYSYSFRKTGGGFSENIPVIIVHYAVKTKFEIK